jgi:hypothetical protein
LRKKEKRGKCVEQRCRVFWNSWENNSWGGTHVDMCALTLSFFSNFVNNVPFLQELWRLSTVKHARRSAEHGIKRNYIHIYAHQSPRTKACLHALQRRWQRLHISWVFVILDLSKCRQWQRWEALAIQVRVSSGRVSTDERAPKQIFLFHSIFSHMPALCQDTRVRKSLSLNLLVITYIWREWQSQIFCKSTRKIWSWSK